MIDREKIKTTHLNPGLQPYDNDILIYASGRQSQPCQQDCDSRSRLYYENLNDVSSC